MVSSEWWGYRVRADVANQYLLGKGIEIGAGANPHRLPGGAECLYFDKSDERHLANQFEQEISYSVEPTSRVREQFPNGADFLIAHNVLEHTASEIATMIEWHGYVREGGVVVLSVPLKSDTEAEKRRILTPTSHLLEDYLFRRGENSYESREHSYGFCLSWDACGWATSWKHLDRDAFVSHVLDQAHFETMDIHWHALDKAGWDFVIATSARLAGKSVSLLTVADPRTENATQGEIIYVYRVGRDVDWSGFPDVASALSDVRHALRRAIGELEAAVGA